MGVWTRMGWGRTGAVSVAVHLLVIAALVHTWLGWASPMPPSGTTHGTQRVLLYLPGKPTVVSERATPRPPRPALRRVSLPTAKVLAEAVSMPAPVVPHMDAMAGNDALGNGSVNIARVQAFPASKPDLAKLPVGASGDVVLDVLIDDTGKVADARTTKGMGHGIDEMVIATVEQWVFYPATKNGRPVSSEQELHFHYDRGRGDQACGWECFALEGQ
jgi:protein TonB